jgi:DNA-binding SARP family transcriptional activator
VPVVEFQLLGPVEMHVHGQPVELGRPQLRAVLAALAVEAGRPVSSDSLVDRVWDGNPPKGARGVLYSHITRIRRALESVEEEPRRVALVRRAAGYVLDVDPDDIDLHRFRRLAAAAGDVRRADQERVGLWRAALGLWRGTPLADVRGQWAARSRAGWQQQRLDAAVAWAQAEVRLGHGDQVIGPVRELLTEHPLTEPLTGTLMRALAAAGRIAEALECYAVTRAQLLDELGTEPGPDLQATHQAILRGEPESTEPPQLRPGSTSVSTPTLAEPVGPAGSGYPRPAQLPLAVRGFTGRQDALDALDALLDQHGGPPSTVVITAVSGTAGIGKTENG